MKKILSAIVLALAVLNASAQSTTVSTTGVIDTDGFTWSNGTYTINFVPSQANPNPNSYIWTGGALTQSFTGSLNGSGVFSVSIPSNSSISPTNSQWSFQICPNAKSGCFQVTTAVTGATLDVTALLNAAAKGPRFPYSSPAFGYGPIEISSLVLPGSVFYNTTSNACQIYGNSAWNSCATGGSGTGTVTGVGTVGSNNIFSNVDSAQVTVNGYLNLDNQLKAQIANCILAGPASGSATVPNCRSLVTADFPASGVSAASYTCTSLTVDVTGRITAASSGSCGGSGTVTSSGSPVSGNISKFSSATNIVPAAAADIVNLFSSCTGTQYLGADGNCHTASGSGTVTASGSPANGNIAQFTSGTNITPATYSQIVALWSSCTGTQYLGFDGSCHTPSGGFSWNNTQLITASSGAATVNWATSNSAEVTCNTGASNCVVTLSNPSNGQPYTLMLCNNATPNTWTFSPTTPLQLATPRYVSECVSRVYTYDGTSYQGPGSNTPPTLLYGTERAVPPASTIGEFVCWWDSVEHQFSCSDNGTNSGNLVTPGTAQPANNWMTYIDSSGTIHYAQPLFSNIGNSLACSQTPAFTGDTTTTAGSCATTTSKINGVSLAGLGTGILKNTTGTGVPSDAAASDVVALFSSCSGTQYLGADGACHTASGSGTVTSSGSPVNGNVSAFSSATNIVPATAANVVALFSSCSGTQYLGADGNCHSASGSGTVTSVALQSAIPNLFSGTAGTAVTTSGTLDPDAQLKTQSANCLVAGPSSGSAAVPTCRTQVVADLPVGATYTVTPAVGSSDTLNCNTTSGITTAPVAFTTTISRAAFTQTAGAKFELKMDYLITTSASAVPTLLINIKDGSTVVYSSVAEAPTTSLSAAAGSMAWDEVATVINASTGSTTTVLNGFQIFGAAASGSSLNHTAQTTSFNTGSSGTGTMSVLMECGSNTASNTVTLVDLTLTRIY